MKNKKVFQELKHFIINFSPCFYTYLKEENKTFLSEYISCYWSLLMRKYDKLMCSYLLKTNNNLRNLKLMLAVDLKVITVDLKAR